MAQLPSKIEPIPPLDRANPAAMPSWPQWLTNSLADLTRGSMSRPTIHQRHALTASQRCLVERHVCELSEVEKLIHVDGAMAKVSELLLAFPSAAMTPESARARARGYMAALEDLPVWAVSEACRRWLRGQCGEANYDFAPSAPRLRKVAETVLQGMVGRRLLLERLLAAEVAPEYSLEHRGTMLRKLSEIFAGLGKPPDPARGAEPEGSSNG